MIAAAAVVGVVVAAVAVAVVVVVDWKANTQCSNVSNGMCQMTPGQPVPALTL